MFERLARRALLDVRPYRPGKPSAELRRELGLRSVVKLASNENPLGPSPKALAAYRRAARRLHVYPEGSSPLLRKELERRWDLPAGAVAVGNGSDELGRLVCEAFLGPGDEGLCSASAFIRFRQWAALMGSKTRLVPEREHRHDLEALAREVGRRTKLVFIASPNNPTGTYCGAAELEAFLRRVPRRVLVLLDEAYYEYAARRRDYPRSLPGLLRRHPNLVVLRTFSKAYGLAGLRVGWLAARPELVAWVDRIRMPFNVSLPAQEAARAALADAGHVRRGVDWVEAERPRLARELERRGLRVVPSSANFVMASAPLPAEELFRRLLRRGVIVRPLTEYGLERCLRITVGSRPEGRRLLAALDKELG